MPRRIGQEIVLLNKVDLATVIADTVEISRNSARSCLSGRSLSFSAALRRAKRRSLTKHYLTDVINTTFKDISLKPALPGFPGLGRKLLNILKTPWNALPGRRSLTGECL